MYSECEKRICFVIFSSKEIHKEIVLDSIDSTFGNEYSIKRLDESLKSEDSQEDELITMLNKCCFGIVIFDGLRPNVLFEYGILKGLNKPRPY